MKNILVGLVTLTTVLVPGMSLAQDEGHARSVIDVISEINQSQNVTSQSDLNCDTVTDDQFEELGDAVMQAMVGDDEAHEAMDNMMGGEGSEALRLMHIAMGQRYLGCAQGSYGTMGMMGGMMSMMSQPYNKDWRGGDKFMMGSSYGPWGAMHSGWGIGMIIFWIVVIIGVVLLVKWLSGQSGVQKGKSALDILKERYAKGEMNKQEFEEKKKDIS